MTVTAGETQGNSRERLGNGQVQGRGSILDRPSVNTIMVRGLGLLGEGLNIYCMWEGCELLWPEGRLWQIALSKDGYHNMFYPTHLTV